MINNNSEYKKGEKGKMYWQFFIAQIDRYLGNRFIDQSVVIVVLICVARWSKRGSR